MKPRYIVLMAGVLACVAAIAVIMMKGNPRDTVSFDAVTEIGEGLLHSVHKAGGILNAVSDQEEMAIGDKIDRKAFLRGNKELESSPLGRYVTDVGSKLVEGVQRKGIRYTFHIIDSACPTAFAAPGGHVYVTTGLLAVLRTESELAGVMAHEIVHVDAKHCIGVIQNRVKVGRAAGADQDDLVDTGFVTLFRPGWSEVQESEADAGSVHLLYQAGYHPYGIVYAFERIDKDEATRGYQNTSLTPVGDTLKALGGIIGRYFATHPSAIDRIDKIKKYIAEHQLIVPGRRFYVGQKNYDHKIPYGQKRYQEEFGYDYPVIAERKTAEKPAQALSPVPVKEEGQLLNEVYTAHGTIRQGMTIAEVEKTFPKELQSFKYDDRIGYKNITFYDMRANGKSETAGLWIEVRSGLVKGIKIIK